METSTNRQWLVHQEANWILSRSQSRPRAQLRQTRILIRTSYVLPGILYGFGKRSSLSSCAIYSNRILSQVVEGDYCDKIANDASLITQDFYFLNQGLDETCSSLQLGTAYCVRAVGDITTYPGYVVEGPSTSFTRPPTSTISVTIPTETLHPHAPGTLDSCTTYVNAVDTLAMEEAFGTRPWFADFNKCTSFAGKYEVSIAKLREWNPSLSEEECVFGQDYSYCVVNEPSGLSHPCLYLRCASVLLTNNVSHYHFGAAATVFDDCFDDR